MVLRSLRFQTPNLTARYTGRHLVVRCLLSIVVIFSCLLLVGAQPALAGLNDDRYDGNIFVLYAGNGSLVPPRVTLTESLQRDRPSLLVFYADDSSDCKRFATVISQLQAPYGRVASFIPVNIDSLSPEATYTPTDPGYYYKGLVPQTVLINQKGKVVLDETGQVAYERIDDVFREVFDLLPRTESVELKRRQFNELNAELTRSDR